MAEEEKSKDLVRDVLGISDILSDVTDKWAEEPFHSGFTIRTILGALFIGIVMLPGLIYMGLVVGTSIGSGAEWVTVLLFLELARRSYQKLRRQELIIMNHMAGSLVGMMGGVMLSGGIFASLIWNQYLKQSEAFRNFNLTDQMPAWFTPSIEVLRSRTFFTEAWIPALAVAVLIIIFSKLQFFGLGYLLFRITSDVEQLPFPLARIGAEGSTALAEAEEKGSWRWTVFSTLAVLGAVWGIIYMGVPSVSTAIFGQRVALIPIPFLDLTPYTENFLPSAAFAVGFDLTLILVAFVIPWRVVIGGTVTCILCQVILPPILYKAGIHKQWQSGFSALDTQIANSLDIWLSVGIGGAISMVITSIYMLTRSAKKSPKKNARTYNWSALRNPPQGRGDWPAWLSVIFFFVSATGFVALCHGLVNLGWLGGFEKPRHEWFPPWVLCVFAFLWTPINSYINARLAGIAGQNISIPYVREGSFFLSGYRHPDIWLAPIPLHDIGGAATMFKQLELTRVKFTSILKVDLLALGVLTAAGFFYWSYLWSLGPIPSAQFPYAQEMWPFIAKNTALWTSALGEGNNQMISAIKPGVIFGSAAIFILVFAILSIGGIPLAYYFGAIGGVGNFPYIAITMLIGLGVRVMVARKVGKENLKRYAPIMMAGFAAGFGISGMVIVALVLIKSAISALTY